MRKRFLSLFTLASFFISLASCSLQKTYDSDILKTSPPSSMTAKKFPEIEMTYVHYITNIEKGKILEANENAVKFLPVPYWNVEPVDIAIDKIDKIKLLEKKNPTPINVFTGFLWGYAIGFISKVRSVGTNPNYRYKEDYEGARPSIFNLSILGDGALGAGIGAIIDNLLKSGTYNFYKMSQSEKIKAIKKIMGL